MTQITCKNYRKSISKKVDWEISNKHKYLNILFIEKLLTSHKKNAWRWVAQRMIGVRGNNNGEWRGKKTLSVWAIFPSESRAPFCMCIWLSVSVTLIIPKDSFFLTFLLWICKQIKFWKQSCWRNKRKTCCHLLSSGMPTRKRIFSRKSEFSILYTLQANCLHLERYTDLFAIADRFRLFYVCILGFNYFYFV